MAKKVFNMQGGLHSAAAYAAFLNRAYGSSVANAASFVVTPGAGMNLNISSGDGLISVDAFLGRLIQVTATETAAVSAANATFNRLDTVVAYIDTAVTPTTSVIDNINDVLKFKVVPGTAAATPVAPTGAAIQASIGAGNPYMVLYDVLLPAAATNVAGVTLTSRRNIVGVIPAGSITSDKIDYTTLKAWIPNYGSQETTDRWAGVTSWTVPTRGFVYAYIYTYTTGSTNDSNIFTINGKNVMEQTVEQAGSNGAKPGTQAGVFPVNAGDVVAYSTNGNVNGKKLLFIPGRWV